MREGEGVDRLGGDDDGGFVSLHNSFVHPSGMAQDAELQQLRNHCFLLLAQRAVKQHFTVVRQVQVVCLF